MSNDNAKAALVKWFCSLVSGRHIARLILTSEAHAHLREACPDEWAAFERPKLVNSSNEETDALEAVVLYTDGTMIEKEFR